MTEIVPPTVVIRDMHDGTTGDGMGSEAQIMLSVYLNDNVALDITVREKWNKPWGEDTYTIDVKETRS